MKAWSVIGLLFAAMIFAMVPISPQVTPRGVELSVDQAQAITYRRARVTARRVDRRAYRSAAYAVGAGAVGYGMGGYYGGYGYPAYSAPTAPSYGTGYGYGSYYGGYSYPAYSYVATVIHPPMLATAIRLMAMAAIALPAGWRSIGPVGAKGVGHTDRREPLA